MDTETFKTFQAFGAATVLYILTIALIEAALLIVKRRGAALTVVMSIVSALLSAVVGLGGGIALSMTGGAVTLALTALVGFFRAIPVLMLIFWTFFLMPMLLHLDVPGTATVVCALAFIGGAYRSYSVHAGTCSSDSSICSRARPCNGARHVSSIAGRG